MTCKGGREGGRERKRELKPAKGESLWLLNLTWSGQCSADHWTTEKVARTSTSILRCTC